ncbi:hypothetical protein HKX48_006064 [Thoreauomyces humboldtii]|nr:hypothetical protein HKX48_006064 [Thoreauomyces humboldtii]
MASTTPTSWLVTGASRGLGFALVAKLAERPNVVIFATARKPTEATSLQILAKKHHPKIHVIKLESTSESDARTAADEIVKIHPTGLDVVVVSAGVYASSPVLTQSVREFRDVLDVNVGGPLIAFQAFWPLLKLEVRASTTMRKFVVVSSEDGSIEVSAGNIPGGTAYGTSKAAVNYLVRSIHGEHKKEGIVAWAIHPGWVKTEMGNECARCLGAQEAPLSIEESITGMLKVIEGASQKTVGGKHIDYQGNQIPW